MKFLMNIFSLLMVPLISSMAWAGDPIAGAAQTVADWGRSQQILQDASLQALLFARCDHYFGEQDWNLFYKEKVTAECLSTVGDFLRILSPQLVRFSHPLSHRMMSEPVAFPTELMELTQDPKVGNFLRAWEGQLELASLGLRRLDTFSLAVKYAGSEAEALRWMAVLFQDISPARAQIQWLKAKIKNPSQIMMAQVGLLGQVIDRMIGLNSGTYHIQAQFSFYPEQVARAARGAYGPVIYHYYVPAYLARRLQQAGHPRAMAMGVPFLFNYLYKAIEESPNPLDRFVSEPRVLRQGVDDSYLGYLGASYGISDEGALLTSAEFQREMTSPGSSLMQMMAAELRRFPLSEKAHFQR